MAAVKATGRACVIVVADVAIDAACACVVFYRCRVATGRCSPGGPAHMVAWPAITFLRGLRTCAAAPRFEEFCLLPPGLPPSTSLAKDHLKLLNACGNAIVVLYDDGITDVLNGVATTSAKMAYNLAAVYGSTSMTWYGRSVGYACVSTLGTVVPRDTSPVPCMWPPAPGFRTSSRTETPGGRVYKWVLKDVREVECGGSRGGIDLCGHGHGRYSGD